MAKYHKHQLSGDRIKAFYELYHLDLLGSYETVSGTGSTLMTTRNIRNALARMAEDGFFYSILDVGCGDFNWFSALDLRGKIYCGVDIIDELIEKNQSRWGEPHVSFKKLDIVTTIPAKYDLVLCRDLFTHFPHNDIVSAFNKIKKSGATYIAISSQYPEMGKSKMYDIYNNAINSNAGAGYWRPVNLTKKPFNLPLPLISIPETDPGKFLDIWRLDSLPEMKISDEIHNPLEPEDFAKYQFFQQLCSLDFINKIAVFGSRGAKTNRPDSDIDIMIFCSPKPTREQWINICDICHKADIPLGIDVVIHCPELENSPGGYFKRNDIYRTLYERTGK